VSLKQTARFLSRSPSLQRNVRSVRVHGVGAARFLLLLTVWLFLFFCSSRVSAAINSWNVASGDWSGTSPCPWTLGREPTSSDYACVQNGGTATINQSGENCNILYLGGTNTGTVLMNGGSLTESTDSYVGYNNTGTFTQNYGTNAINHYLYIGYNSGTSGTYNLNNTAQLSASREYIGYSGAGSFVQTGGTNTISDSLYLGFSSSAADNYTLSGTGQLIAGSEFIYSCSGTGFTQTGGTNTTSNLYIGASVTSKYNLSGSGELISEYEYIGCNGSAAFTQSAGTNTTRCAQIGTGGTYTLSGGVLNVNGGLEVRGKWDLSNSSATINLTSGIINLAGTILATANNATLNITDTQSLLVVPAGHDPSEYFAHINNAGSLVHQAGTPLDIAPGTTIHGTGVIDDHLNCQGTFSARMGYFIDLKGGATVTDAGSVSLGYGAMYVNDATSSISGGSFNAGNLFVGATDAGSGTFSHTGGTNTTSNLYLGYNYGASGTYNLSGSSQLTSESEYIGYSQTGSGTFGHTEGTNSATNLYIGYNTGASGTYNLSGSGQLTAGSEYIGHTGTGTRTFAHTSGTNSATNLYIGYNSGASGTYNLSGSGQLTAGSEYIGYTGTGTRTFGHTGGTNSATNLYVGYNSGASGTYNLSGSGQLTAGSEYIGFNGTGTLAQTGGSNSFTYAKIGSAGTYTLSSGTLNINGGFDNSGTWNLASSTAVVNLNSAIVSISGAVPATGQNATLNIDSHSLLIVPNGDSASAYFATIVNNGLIHEEGTTLDIPAAYSISGILGWTYDHVNCAGSLAATPGFGITLYSGLTITDAGSVNLRTGTLYVSDTISGMSGGSLYADYQYVSSPGTFTHSGGTNSTMCLYLRRGGVGSGDNYILSGTGQLIAGTEYIGYTGSGTRTFTQTGGTNTVTSNLYLGYNSGTSGTYNLNGGTLVLKSISIGSGSATFNFGGGTLQASGDFTLTIPMTLTGTNGNANIDTAGHSVTLSGVLSGAGGLNKLGSGILTLTSSTNFSKNIQVLGGEMDVSYEMNGDRTIAVTGSGSTLSMTNSGSLRVGSNASGSLTIQNGGTVNVISGGDTSVGSESASQGHVTITGAGSLLNASSTVVVGQGGSGELTVADSGHAVTTASLYAGMSGSSSGQISVTGNGSKLEAGGLYLGMYGTSTATLQITNGALATIAGDSVLGETAHAEVTVDGAGSTLNIGNLTAGNYSPSFGSLTVSGGAKANASGMATIGNTNSANGHVTVTGADSELSVRFDFLIGRSGSGLLTIADNGTVHSGNLQIGTQPGSAGTLDLDGGILDNRGGTISIGSGGTFHALSGTIEKLGRIQDADNPSTTLPLVKTGTGTLSLVDCASFSGNIQVLGGRLEIAGGIDPSGTSLIDVQSGTAALLTVAINKPDLDISTAALTTFEIVNGSHTVGAITGSGTSQLDANASLTATSISQGTITLAPGATLTIAAIPGGPTAASSIVPVPEPSVLAILSCALIMGLSVRMKRRTG
jgi:T5SS/PEP-CTERM-associated repeat protein